MIIDINVPKFCHILLIKKYTNKVDHEAINSSDYFSQDL